ncbi:hypothetical protein K4B79_29185 [Streptomyces lincolnensis]|uniref:Rv1733c family protein n=1 Tax=Streptomyces lincolnensis TaxID=1915 RepID=UPI001E3B1091|nr:hypothetical protein [Streptomyces lincolnensis]MCD7442282.1 hypothetical protein [Streptomyces lincolnensis]
MREGRRTTKRLWRWRNSPLRRRDDVLEAWLVLTVWVIAVVGGTLAGTLTAGAADEVFSQQRAERTSVRAVLLADTASASAKSYRAVAKVRWTTPDGSTRTDSTLVKSGQKAGSRIVVWTDRQGNLTTAPPSPTNAVLEAGFLGAVAALAVTGAAFGAGRAARWGLDRRRIARWSEEWDLVGPLWSQRTS